MSNRSIVNQQMYILRMFKVSNIFLSGEMFAIIRHPNTACTYLN